MNNKEHIDKLKRQLQTDEYFTLSETYGLDEAANGIMNSLNEEIIESEFVLNSSYKTNMVREFILLNSKYISINNHLFECENIETDDKVLKFRIVVSNSRKLGVETIELKYIKSIEIINFDVIFTDILMIEV